MNETRIGFELSVIGLADAVRVQISEAGERAVASVQVGSATFTGLGASVREALVAALSPLGARTTTAIMAAPAMFGVSARLMAATDTLRIG